MVIASLLISLIGISPSIAQIPLPSPQYIPPNATFGVSSSPSTSERPNRHWSTLLGNLLFFYDIQRSGKLPSDNRVAWRNDSVPNDGQDANIDLSGGYFDAGDYVKATFPLSFTLMSVCWGALDYGAGYDNANQTAYLDSMIRWGLDWMINAHPNPRTLFVQVADSQTDQSYWGGDQDIPGPRPSFQINDSSPGTDAAAQASAAFAACSLLYSGQRINNTAASASLTNSTYAQTLLAHALQLYDFAVNASAGLTTYQTSVPEVGLAYPSTAYGDELVTAALFLSLTNSTSVHGAEFYSQAESFWRNYSLAGSNGVLNWDDKTPALPVLFAQIAMARSDLSSTGNNISEWKGEAERYFDDILGNKGPGFLTDGGLLYYSGESDGASLNPSLNAAMLMLRYAPMSTTAEKTVAYQDFARRQIDYALGKNPMSVPYVVGSNPNSPANPHSALASGGTDIGDIDASPPQEAHILYGGVVGGPDSHDRYFDIRSDWPQTEVALDYVAPMLTLAAYNVLTNNQDPFYTSLQPGAYDKLKPTGFPCDAAFQCHSPSLPTWATITMGTIVGLVGLFLTVLGLYWILLCIRAKS
ncbi:glycoside hydrolase family 9 protein [Hysterangium stoloniferum]|nr:glycoside hydrolase family 9 protein [Hysterangium stoloniferum]